MNSLSVSFDDFETSLRSYWAPTWNGGQTLTRSASIVRPDAGTYVLHNSATTPGNCSGGVCGYNTYIHFDPLQTQQGDRYFYERSLGTWPTIGSVRTMEFWGLPDAGHGAPHTARAFTWTGGTGPPDDSTGYLPTYLSLGTFTMAPSRKGLGDQEGQGWHWYHSLPWPNSGGRWIKYKMLRPAGKRQAGGPPIWSMTRNTTNEVAFQDRELVTCSPSGGSFKFTYESGATILGLYGASAPANGDTLTGTVSGASRTISTMNGRHELASSDDLLGAKLNYNGDYMIEHGCHYEWYADNANYWDRCTRIYWETVYVFEAEAPHVDCFDDVTVTTDTRDDYVAISNLCAFYHSTEGKLFLGISRNGDMNGKTWEVRTSNTDIHTLGFSNATAWTSRVDSGIGWLMISFWENFTPAAGDTIYIAVRPSDRSTFTQIAIPVDTLA